MPVNPTPQPGQSENSSGVSGRSEPRPSGPEPRHEVRFFGTGRASKWGVIAACEPCDWTVGIEGGHTVAELSRLDAMHRGHVSSRRSAAARSLLDVPVTATGVAPDGSATLSPAGLLVALGALADGVALHGARIGRCPACSPGRVCDRYEDSAAALASYRSLARALGDDR
jgi:hypothetical protein